MKHRASFVRADRRFLLPRVGDRLSFTPYFSPNPDPPSDPPADPSKPTFDQEAVNKLTGSARTEGRQAIINQYAELLGLDKNDPKVADTIKSMLTDAKAKKDAELTEAQRLEREKQTAEERATSLENDMRQTLIDTKIETRSQRIKIGDVTYTPKQNETGEPATNVIARLVDREKLTVDLKARSVAGVDEALAEIVKQYPYLFDSDQQAQGNERRPVPSPTPRGGSQQKRNPLEAHNNRYQGPQRPK